MAITTLIGAQNLLKTATLTASADSANVDNLWDTFLTDFWQPGAGAQTVIIDNGTAKSFNYWGVSANLGSDSASIAIAWSDDDISYTTIETLSPTTDAVIFSSFTSVSHRYIKITVTGTAPKISHINVGVSVQPDGTLSAPFVAPKHSHMRQIDANISETGIPIGNIVRYEKNSIQMNFRNVLPSWIDSNFDALYADMVDDLFFIKWDSAGRATETAIAWLTGDINPTWQNVTYMGFTIKANCRL